MDYKVDKDGNLIKTQSDFECVIDGELYYIYYDYIEPMETDEKHWYVFYNSPYLGYPNVFSVVNELKEYLQGTEEFKSLLFDNLDDYIIDYRWDFDPDNKFWSLSPFHKEIIIEDDLDIEFLEKLFIYDKYDIQGSDTGHYIDKLDLFKEKYFKYKYLIDKYVYNIKS